MLRDRKFNDPEQQTHSNLRASPENYQNIQLSAKPVFEILLGSNGAPLFVECFRLVA